MKHTCIWCGKKFSDGYSEWYCSERCKRSYDNDDDWVEEYDKNYEKISKTFNELMKD